MKSTLPLIVALWVTCISTTPAMAETEGNVQLATFDIDVTPPVGSMMAYDPVRRHDELTLRARGIVLKGDDRPIVLCAFDWIGIANESYDRFRKRLAIAAKTTPDRVALHCLHQHDAPRCDFSSEQILNNIGIRDLGPFAGGHQREVLQELESAVASACKKMQVVTHAGFGVADVVDVASNRRLLDNAGKVWATRYTTCRDPKMRAEPDGTIDPQLSCLVFYDGDNALASLTYYACHPQSYYRTGVPSPDFPGIARFLRGQDAPGPLHVHFNGAGGNIGAGKYNDGKKENRMILARRVAQAMREAFDSAKRFPITPSDVGWRTHAVTLKPAPHLDADELTKLLTDVENQTKNLHQSTHLAWLRRCEAGHKIDLSCLKVGNTRVLHMPGELFVEYQLAAKELRPDLSVAMAAYGDYGTGYIGTEIAYGQGGYETSERASRVDKSCEKTLMNGIRQLLEVNQ